MNNAVYDPENYCPICGSKLPENQIGAGGHECNATKLKAIDAARKRDYTQIRQPSEEERIKDGFAMIDDDGYPDDPNEPDPDRYFS